MTTEMFPEAEPSDYLILQNNIEQKAMKQCDQDVNNKKRMPAHLHP